MKQKEFTLKIKRINANQYIVDGKEMNWLELQRWFQEKMTEGIK